MTRDSQPEEDAMTRVAVVAALLALAPAASSQSPWDVAKKAAGSSATSKLEKEVNKRLLEEGRKNQCSFKSGTDVLEPGCDGKMKKLSNALVDAKKKLNGAGVQNFKFVVSGHTDSSGNAAANKELSAKRAAVVVKELVAKGIPEGDIQSVGMGSEKPLVKPDDTPAKKAKNRRYEIQVKI
jgi:outer membrane protein OmpA-like peptidoglycan-associated protein